MSKIHNMQTSKCDTSAILDSDTKKPLKILI